MTAWSTIQQRERELTAALRDGGLRRTPQRLEVISELARATDHPDAEELFQRVRVRMPTISLDTVYRTVAVLVERGLVEAISTPHATRFDPDRSPHHHFVCVRCGRFLDVGPQAVTLDVSRAVPGVAEVSGVRVELRGLCLVCAGSLRDP